MVQRIYGAEPQALIAVFTRNDLDWLVKESELMTGAPGRHFVVLGGDRLTYHVRLEHDGYHIRRTNSCDTGAPLRATASELFDHTLGRALACGALYTSALQ